MTKEQIEAVLGRMLTWPPEKQELAVKLLLSIEGEADDAAVLSPEEEAELDEATAEADRGEFLPDEEVTAFFARFR
jgi:hypothetical protein